MQPTYVSPDRDIFTVESIFTEDECQSLIRQGEAMGFEAASVTTDSGAQMMPNVRNNDRVVYDDAAFAASLWERVKAYVPQQIDGYPAVGLNERLRLYRYDPGQRFKRHQDGRVYTADGRVSRLSSLIYLNAGYKGGETIVREYTTVDDQTIKHEFIITAEAGKGLFFIHERKHEGAVIRSGRKYLLRTDVMYAGAPQDGAATD